MRLKFNRPKNGYMKFTDLRYKFIYDRQTKVNDFSVFYGILFVVLYFFRVKRDYYEVNGNSVILRAYVRAFWSRGAP